MFKIKIMANSLTITKLSDGSFSFVLNGDTANTIINLRNDMTSVGDEVHIKSSNGANLIKEQQILYNEVTIVDGATLPVATSSIDLRVKLRSVGFWDWLRSGSGTGIDRFDELLDTFPYFGQDGKIPMVDESQLKLVPYQLPDMSYLEYLPFPLVANKFLQVNDDASAIILVDSPASSTPVPFNYKVTIDYTTDPTIYALPTGARAVYISMNGVEHTGWSQTGINVTISGYTPTVGYTDKATIYYQL